MRSEKWQTLLLSELPLAQWLWLVIELRQDAGFGAVAISGLCGFGDQPGP